MHEDFGAHASREPGTDARTYRIDVMIDGVSERAALALMHCIADLVVEDGIATPEGGDVRAVLGMQEHATIANLTEAIHVLIPKAVPQSPNLGIGYSPN